jgi:hypothetical protein
MVEGLAPSWAQPRCSGGPEENYRTSVRQARSSRIARRLTPPSGAIRFQQGGRATRAGRLPETSMDPTLPLSRRTALRVAAALVAGALAGGLSVSGAAHSPPLPRTHALAQVDVYDRATGSVLPLFEKDGRHYIVGYPGHEYAVRIRNTTGYRILAVTSVDGVNVVSGETATPAQSGYVIDPWGSVEISGWRKSLSRTAAFFFTEHSNSYAARTGRPFDVGVIGVAVFAERVARHPMRISESTEDARAGARREAKTEADAAAPASAAPPMPSSPATGAASSLAEGQRDQAEPRERAANAQPLAKLGTGHGRSETSHVRQVAFERATSDPGQIVAIQYDRHENLVALGVLPAPPHHYARRAPQPFPGMRFVPDPR